jgi:hypothetical protein
VNPRRVSPLHIALLMWGFSFGFAPVRADKVPEVTNTIESLTPEQARKLVAEFEGDELPLNGLKTRVKHCFSMAWKRSTPQLP